MTTFLSTFAQRHFDERPRQSLLAGLASRMDGRNLMQALGSGCRPLQHLAWRRMAEWSEAEVDSLVERSLPIVDRLRRSRNSVPTRLGIALPTTSRPHLVLRARGTR